MKIGILCAGDREVAPFLDELKEPVTTEKAMLKFYEGKLGGMYVVSLYSGVCKVNAAIAAQILIDAFHVDCIINAGVAGGIDPALDLFDTVIATECVYHDVAPEILTEFHPWMESVFFKSDESLLDAAKIAAERLNMQDRLHFGRMATGEAFITDEGRQEIISGFSPLTVDMETAAVAHVCYVNKVSFIAIRSITDTAEHSGTGNFEENCAKAAEITRDVTVELLRTLREKLA